MQTIVIVSKDTVLASILKRSFRNLYKTVVFSNITSVIDFIYNSIPNLVVIDIAQDDRKTIEIINNIKSDPIFSPLPVLAVLHDDAAAISDWDSLLIEDYLRKSDIEREIASRVALCITRSQRIVEINPLTRLPGNISINRQIQSKLDLGEIFALAYLDLDQFKPFNDKYGFSRGDEIIKVTGRLILNIVKNKQPQNSFIGHIGGDDFIYIMDIGLVEDASAEIIESFDRIVPTFYDDDDRERGLIQSKDRQGNERTFSIMTTSIGIAHNQFMRFTHYGEITEMASKMKSHAKKFKGSCFKIDKRQGNT